MVANFVVKCPCSSFIEVDFLAVLPLRFAPDSTLRQKAKRIRNIDNALLRLIEDMIETMHAESGVGLAANQVGVLQKVAVIQLPEDDEALVLINPEITRREGEREVEEGCLSIPGYRGTLIRSETVRAKALDRSGKLFRIKAQDLLAQALEHETGHLSGGLYIDHITNPDELYKMEPRHSSENGSSSAEEQGNLVQAVKG
jgi:peptide deformylase